MNNVDICNYALNHLGQRSITSLTESSNEARKCSQVFELVRDSVLRAHDWSFASKTDALAMLSETIIGWDYLYTKPVNCLFVRRVFNLGNEKEEVPTEFEELKSPLGIKAIATDIDEAYAKYTVKITDPNDYDSNFVEAFSYKIASVLAKPLTGDMAIMTEMERLYNTSLPEAKRVNKSGGYKKPSTYSSYLSAR